jgi:hypothetical protein
MRLTWPWKQKGSDKSPNVPPATDLVLEAQDADRFRATVLPAGIAAIPLIGIIVFAAKLDIQLGGNVNIALAVVNRLAVSTLAIVLLLTILPTVMLGLLIGSTRIVRNRSYSESIRRANQWLLRVSFVVILLSQSWVWSILAILALVGEIFLSSIQGKTTTLTSEQWANGGAPGDSMLRDYWTLLRKALERDGVALAPQSGESQIDVGTLSSDEIVKSVISRNRDIQVAQRKTPQMAVLSIITTIVATFGLNIVISTVNLVPLEQFSIKGNQAQVGYIFTADTGPDLVLDEAYRNAQYINSSLISHQRICPSPAIPSIVGLFAPTTDKPCPT